MMFNLQVSVFKDLLRFAQVFSQMLHIGIEIPFAQVIIYYNEVTAFFYHV
jgi:hypothetical protein